MILENLLFAFVVILITVGIIGLFLRAGSVWNRTWLTFLTISLIAGTIGLLLYPAGFAVYWYLWLPMIILAVVLGGWLSWQSRRSHPDGYSIAPGDEPRYTQEEMRGAAGTRAAVGLYLGVLLISLGIGLLIRFLFSLVW